MTSVALAAPRTLHPDAVRIVALSAAISLNLAMLLVAMRPLAVQWVAPAPPTPTPTLTLEHPLLPVPPITLQPLPQAPRVPLQVTPVDVPLDIHVASDVSRVRLPSSTVPASTPQPAEPAPGMATPGVPVAAQLAYRQAPPPHYPLQARRMHMQGTVTLRVLVDASGQPLRVEIAQSSGHALLDRTAREQVLQHWRFQPAQVDGHAVSAWARVPVTFSLRRH